MARSRVAQLNDYRELVEYGLPTGEAPGFAEEREALAEVALDSEAQQELAFLDECAVDLLRTVGFIDACWLKDAQDQPLAHWWWHLGKLRAGTYPADRLPPHLRVIYWPASAKAA